MIRVHKTTGTVVCMATNPANLHSKYGEQLGLSDDYEDRDVEFAGRVGDLADGTVKPENYPVEPPAPPDPVGQLSAKLDAMLARIEALEAARMPASEK